MEGCGRGERQRRGQHTDEIATTHHGSEQVNECERVSKSDT